MRLSDVGRRPADRFTDGCGAVDGVGELCNQLLRLFTVPGFVAGKQPGYRQQALAGAQCHGHAETVRVRTGDRHEVLGRKDAELIANQIDGVGQRDAVLALDKGRPGQFYFI